MTTEVRVFNTPEEMASAVAEAVIERLAAPVPPGSELPAYEVALTGGTIAREIHRNIATQADRVDWGYVRFWFGDERFVPADSPDRNAQQARADLLDTLLALPGAWPAALGESNVMEVPAVGEVADVATAAEVYSDLLRHEGTGAWELVMLGMGPDGHVASLFPGHPAAAVTDAITVPVTDSPKPPAERVSLTFEALTRNAKAVWFLVTGAEKAPAVARALAPSGSTSETPARGIAEHADNSCQLVWWLDEAAAADL